MCDDAELTQLAQQLRSDPFFHDTEVVAGPGQGVVTVLTVAQGYRPGHMLRRHVRRLAGEIGGQLQVVLTGAIPRGPGGVVDHDELLAAMRRPGAVHRFEPPASAAERLVAELVLEVLPGVVEVSMTDSLPALGGGSLATFELTGLISERLGIDIDPQQVFGAESLRELAAMLAERENRRDPA